MTKYIIKDNEGYNFCEWGSESPRTRKEIINYFRELNLDESYFYKFKPYPLKDYSLRMISSIWNVSINKVKGA